MKYCSNCAAEMGDVKVGNHPHCSACNTTHWKNPLPVAILLQPVLKDGKLGLVIGQRGIAPIGGWALPGGFMELGENITEATIREMQEESGCDRDDFVLKHFADEVTPNGHLLIFMENETVWDEWTVGNLYFTEEMTNWAITFGNGDYRSCFPLHHQVINDWFRRRYLGVVHDECICPT